MNDEFEEWVRDQTSVRKGSGPRHCLSDIYQPWNPKSLHTGVPAFVQRLPCRKVDPNWPSANPEEMITTGSKEWHEAMHELDVKRFKLIRETWNEFAELLSEGNTSSVRKAADRQKAYLGLVRQKQSMRTRAERLATAIDERFQVTDPDSQNKTNELDQARELYSEIEKLRREHGPDTLLRENFSAETRKLNWRAEIDAVPAVRTGLSRPQRDDYSKLGSLTRTLSGIGGEIERPCFRPKDMGFRCGLEWIPADSTLGEVVQLLALHFTGLEDEARELGNTHALLCYRLETLETVLHEYDLYGNVETKSVAETTEVTWPHEKGELDDGRYEINLGLFLEEVKKTLECGDPDTRSEVWNIDEPVPTVSYPGLKRELPLESRKKSGGGHIERPAVRQNVEKHFAEIHLRRLRKKAFLNG